MTDIEKLSREFSAWKDEQIKHNRYVDDILENLDDINLTTRIKNYVSKAVQSSAGFEVIANENGAMARMFAEYQRQTDSALSEIRATASAQGAEINIITQWQSTVESSIATIDAKSDANGASITSLVNYTGYDPQSSKDIQSKVEAWSEATAEAATAGILSNYSTTDEVNGLIKTAISGVYVFNDKDEATVKLFANYYKGDQTTAADIVLNAGNGESSAKIHADHIEFGDYAGVLNGAFYTRYLYDGIGFVENRPGAFWWGLSSSYEKDDDPLVDEPIYQSEFALWRIVSLRDYLSTWEPHKQFAFRLENGDATGTNGQHVPTSKFSLYSYKENGQSDDEYEILGINNGIGTEAPTAYPKSKWDFSNANVTGLRVYFS